MKTPEMEPDFLSGEKKKTVIGVVPKSAWTTSIENFL
ncbi:unnamed protein product, partial [Vitis vinifera]